MRFWQVVATVLAVNIVTIPCMGYIVYTVGRWMMKRKFQKLMAGSGLSPVSSVNREE